MAYIHPLAYLIGLEGHALMRAFAGDFADRAFVEGRLAEIGRLLADADLAGAGVELGEVDAPAGYQVWSRTYDAPGNGAFPLEEPYVLGMLDGLPAGRALDAACGTGRYARHLAARGHMVIGVDSSAQMLAIAQDAVPGAEFRLGALQSLPLDDASVDVAVCALALTHVRDLAPVMTEFARVLRPGGQLLVSNMHADTMLFGSIPRVRTDDGQPARIATWRHETTDYFRAAMAAGFSALACEEPRMPLPPGPPQAGLVVAPRGDWQDWPWSLDGLAPQAAWAARLDRPATVIWRFQRA